MIRLAKTVAALLVLALSVQPALGCLMDRPRVSSDIEFAEVVVVGQVTGYEVAIFSQHPPWGNYGVIRVQVVETWKGEDRRTWEFHWWNSTFKLPDEWRYGSPVLIAGIDPRKPHPSRFFPRASVRGAQRPDLLQVLQAPCASPFIFRTVAHPTDVERHHLRAEQFRRSVERADERTRAFFSRRLEQHVSRSPQKLIDRQLEELRSFLE